MMAEQPTFMRKEILAIPEAVDRLLIEGRPEIEAVANSLSDVNPSFITTVARGSSDHAATFFKYACELATGVPVASIGPSIASIFDAQLKLERSACISISQSGKSPDIVAMAKSATRLGALTVAITNDRQSDLSAVCNHTIDIHAGVEQSVAATKTFVTSAVAGLALLAYWTKDAALLAALNALPAHLEKATAYDWPELREQLTKRDSLYVLGRGPSFAMSNEAALKFKETCQIHAESYSSAEVLHGPVSIVEAQYPVLVLASRDAAQSAIVSVADELAQMGAAVFATSDKVTNANRLDFVATDHPLTDPLALIVSFYAFIEKLAGDRDQNPDEPRHLRKVTETV